MKKILVNSIVASVFLAASSIAVSAANVSWITKIYNSSSQTVYMTNEDTRNNGCVYTNSAMTVGEQCNDYGEIISLKPNTVYFAYYMGIPWYAAGRHYRTLSSDKNTIEVTFAQDQVPNIVWKDPKTGKVNASQYAGECGTSEYELLISEDNVISLQLAWNQCNDWKEMKRTVDTFYTEVNRAADLALKLKKLSN